MIVKFNQNIFNVTRCERSKDRTTALLNAFMLFKRYTLPVSHGLLIRQWKYARFGEEIGVFLKNSSIKNYECLPLQSQRMIQEITSKLPPITYYWTGFLILDHSYIVGNLTNSKIAETEALEPLKSSHFCISNFRTCWFPNEIWVVQDYGHCPIIGACGVQSECLWQIYI